MAPSLHVVMLPWSAFGHLIPFLKLSKALARSGVRVTYVSTPRNIQRLPRIPPGLEDLLSYEEVAMPRVEELPIGAEATPDLAFEQIQYLKVAYDLLEEPFSQIIANHSPDWIVTDFVSHWAIGIAEKYGVPHMFFSAFSAATYCFAGPNEYLVGEGQRKFRGNPESLMTKPPWIPFPSSAALLAHEAADFHAELYKQDASGTSTAQRIARVLEGCQAVAICTCRELEGDYIDLYKVLIQKPVLPVGLLPPEPQQESDPNLDGTWGTVFKWLDKQNSRSVVFAGFGTEYKLTKEDVHEIAYGLELSGFPFLWALRRPSWAVEDSDALPEGFRVRTSGKGVVCFEWAPQQRILAHPSVGGSLIHAGWGSVTETVQYGHSLIALPFIIDQGIITKVLADKNLAIVVERREDGSFSRDSIAQALRKAMVEEQGERTRACARNAAEVFGDAKLQQEHYIGGLVEYMRNASKKPST